MKQEEISCIDQHFLAFCHITFRKSILNIFICHTSSSRNNSKHMVSYQLFPDQGNYIYIPVRSLYKLSNVASNASIYSILFVQLASYHIVCKIKR